MDNLNTSGDLYEAFEYFLKVVVLLEKCGNRLMSLSEKTLKIFFQEDLPDYDDVSEVCEAIDKLKIVEKYGDYGRKKMIDFNKTVGFV